jgi:hypothetical protein
MAHPRTGRRVGPPRRQKGKRAEGSSPAVSPAGPVAASSAVAPPLLPAPPIRDNPAPAAARRRTLRQRLRWRPLTAVPAWVLAIVGIAGLISTIRSAPPPPPASDPIRYTSGTPLADRLVVVLAPQLDERGLTALRMALGLGDDTPTNLFTVDRPGFASFDEATLQLFAGNVAGGATPPLATDTPGQLPDTVVRGVAWQGRGVALVGPSDWRALFGVAAFPSPSASTTPAKSDALLAEASAALRTRQSALVLLELRDLTMRDLRDESGGLRPDLATLAASLTTRDALLIVAGGGVTGEALRLSLSGAGVKSAPVRTLALNDLAPTCAVLIGAPYPFEARGRIAWPLLDAGARRKAEATIGLARQRSGLVVGTLPLGAVYPPALRTTILLLPDVDAAIAQGQYAYAYQLGSSALDQADRLLANIADAAPLPISRRAAPNLVAACVAAALYALLLLALGRSWGTLGAALGGAALALVAWVGIAVFLQRIVVPRLALVVGLTSLYGLIGGGTCAALAGWFVGRGPLAGNPAARPGWRAVEALALLAALPAAACAYRYGFPWRLRLEETLPLFRWRSALLAPACLLLAGYAWILVQAWLGGRAHRPGAEIVVPQ